jgi:hypothetical protein
MFEAGRFVLTFEGGYVTSWDTWEDAGVAWDDNGFIPKDFQLEDTETGRIWSHGARHVWEDAAT